jgi:membrane fusion protein, multidrug efflux system
VLAAPSRLSAIHDTPEVKALPSNLAWRPLASPRLVVPRQTRMEDGRQRSICTCPNSRMRDGTCLHATVEKCLLGVWKDPNAVANDGQNCSKSLPALSAALSYPRENATVVQHYLSQAGYLDRYAANSTSRAPQHSSGRKGMETLMARRRMPLGLRTAMCALSLATPIGVAKAQGTTAPAVTVTPVASRQVTETGDFIGRVTAIDKVDIVARVPGFIEERKFTEGQQVKKGDLLFRIEQATYKAAVEQQRANLAKAKATEANTKIQLERGRELVRNQNIPQATLDQRAADEAAAQANVMEAQALLDQAQINLGYTEIRSPIDGRIGLAVFTEGNLVQPSSGKLATIVRQDPIYIVFQASERDVLEYKQRIAESQNKNAHVTVHLKLPNGRSYPYAGISNFLDVQVDANTDTVAVRAEVSNPDNLLIPSGIVGVTVERGAPQSALVVPQSAVQLDQAGRYVLVVDQARKVEQRRITTGVEQGPDIVVSDGLKEGELVIVEGIQKVRPGQAVAATIAPGN